MIGRVRIIVGVIGVRGPWGSGGVRGVSTGIGSGASSVRGGVIIVVIWASSIRGRVIVIVVRPPPP